MRYPAKTLSLMLCACMWLSAAQPLAAQALPAGLLRPRAQNQALEDALKVQLLLRTPDMNVQTLSAQLEREGRVDARVLAAVVSDQKYLLTLDAQQAAFVAYTGAFAYAPDAASQQALLQAVLNQLTGDFDERDESYALKYFYAETAAAMGRNIYLWREVEAWAFKQAAAARHPLDDARRNWAGEVLMMLALPPQETQGVFVMDNLHRAVFENRLKQLIIGLDGLKNENSAYMMRLGGMNVKNVLGTTNQGALISLFAQVNSFFAFNKEASGFWENAQTFISTGGLNDLGRMTISAVDPDKDPQGFSDRKEVFYIHHVTPGTDGNGRFAATPSGRRHRLLSQLVTALFLSFHTRSAEESSALMQDFIRGYIQAGPDGRFARYLYVPLQGLRLGLALHDNNSLYGWEKEADALEKELYQTLKEGYPWNRVCTGVQGACEVTAEWVLAGKVFKLLFRALGGGAKLAGKGINAAVVKPALNRLSPQALMRLGLLQMAGAQGRKAVIRWTRTSVAAALERSGWNRLRNTLLRGGQPLAH